MLIHTKLNKINKGYPKFTCEFKYLKGCYKYIYNSANVIEMCINVYESV